MSIIYLNLFHLRILYVLYLKVTQRRFIFIPRIPTLSSMLTFQIYIIFKALTFNCYLKLLRMPPRYYGD